MFNQACSGDSHLFIWSSSSTQPDYRPGGYCKCGLFYYDAQEKRVIMMYGHPMNYNPFGPHAPQPAAPDVPIEQFKAAQAVNATHLSADGGRAYCTRYGLTLVAKWDQWAGFGAWEEVPEGLPADAVKMK